MDTLQKIGAIRFQQEYSKNSLKGLQLNPTYETQLLIKNGAIVLYQFEGTIEVYARKHIHDSEIISFWVEVKDALFFNYTDLPSILPNENYILHFSPQIQEDLNEFSRPVSVVSKIHRYTKGNPVSEDTEIAFYDLNNEVVYKNTIEKGNNSCIIDLSLEHDGIYERKINEDSEPLLITNKQLKSIVGICSFNVELGVVKEVDIKFHSNQTHWEYLIITKENKPQHSYTIVDGSGVITFSYKGIVPLASNVEALCFLSDQKIEFKEYPNAKIKLVRTSSEGNSFLPNMEYQLPYPHPENIKKLETEKAFKAQTICYI